MRDNKDDYVVFNNNTYTQQGLLSTLYIILFFFKEESDTPGQRRDVSPRAGAEEACLAQSRASGDMPAPTSGTPEILLL